MKKYLKSTQEPGQLFSWFSILTLGFGLTATSLSGQAIFEEDFEPLQIGTLDSTTHPGWSGMLPGNISGQPITDWEIVDSGGLDWVAPDGGVIDGGFQHLVMKSFNEKTGRAFYDFSSALPTDIGSATSLYLRYTVAFDQLENITEPESEWRVWPLIRFNSSWQMRSIIKFQHVDWDTSKQSGTRFFAELHDDKDAIMGIKTHVTLEEKLGAPQAQTTYFVVTRYDFNDLGDLTGQAIWVNPNFADGTNPDLVSIHAEPLYSTFVNPIISMDITTYGGTMRYDNFKIANAWEEVVPAAASTATWAGFDMDSSNNVDTGDWLGIIHVNGDWVYSFDLSAWLYLPESQVDAEGAWTFVP